ncbi:MAG TPA: hypothetical protein VFJ16_10755, partial [Longimicrobium sp.]|nr:hypothetical protein [Longimicrobium sp.]
ALGTRTWAAAGLFALAVGAAAAVALATLAAAPPSGYAQSYGHAALSPARLLGNLGLIVLPLSRTLAGPAWLSAALLGGVAVLGWAVLLRRAHHRRAYGAALLLALLVPALGAAAYLPWPRMERFYALPFLVGPMVLLGVGVTAAARRFRPLYVLLPLVAGLTLAAADASADADESIAVRQMNGVMARALGAMQGIDTVLVAIPYEEPAALAWQGPGPTLRRYALATGVAGPDAPAVVDVTCSRAAARFQLQPPHVAFISYPGMCGPLPPGALVVDRPYAYMDLLFARSLPRTARADLWLPRAAAPVPPAPGTGR